MKAAVNWPMVLKKREGLLASRPSTYIWVILIAILVGVASQFRARTIFACQADGYNADQYIAYCNGASYADYEHGAFWFDLEPAVQDFARNAGVLFLGNSRLQVAFSTVATDNFFSAISARYYLLGFTYNENVIMAEELLRKMKPRAKVYVINVDDFFDRAESVPMKAVLHDPGARDRYEVKRRWQQVHEPICKTLPVLCGDGSVVVRSRETGAYRKFPIIKETMTPISYDWVINQNVVKSNVSVAIDFLSHLAVPRECVILTMVPTVETKIGNVTAIAEALGENLMTPELVGGLQTFDGSHLDKPSAERWSQAFFRAVGSKIRTCLGI